MDDPEAPGPVVAPGAADPPGPADPGSAPVVPASPGPLGNLVAAHLQRVEIALLGRILTTTLAGALPPAMVRVERRRTLLERLRRRPGQAVGVSLTSDDRRLTFRAPEVGVTEASISHVVGGVVLSTRPVTVEEWLTTLAQVLNQATEGDDATRRALERVIT